MAVARLARGRLGGLALAFSLANAARGSTGWLALVHPIQATALFAAMVFLLASGPRARELMLFSAGSVALCAAHRAWFRLFHFTGVPLEQSALVAAGLASVLALGARAAASSDRDGDDWGWFHLALVLPAFGIIMGLCLDLTIPLHAWAWDPMVFALDAGFGQPSLVVGRLAAAHPALLTLLSLVYLFLPVMMAAIIALERRRQGAGARQVLRPILLAAFLGYALYQIYPVVGPSPLFGARFPFGAVGFFGPARRLVDVRGIAEPRNCMPSLHVAWALILCWHARPLGPRARLVGAIWLVLTILATLAMGQHYFVDLVVAVPFAALVDVLAGAGAPARGPRARRRLIATTVVLLVGWYAILLLAPPAPPAGAPIGLFALLTIAVSWTLHARWAAVAPVAPAHP